MKSKPRGFTLIEVVAAMSIFTVIFGTVLLTLHVMFDAQDRIRDGFDQSLQQSRFAAQWRADVHAAEAYQATTGDDKNSSSNVLVLSLPGEQSVEYLLKPTVVERVVRSTEGSIGRETFRVCPLVDRGWVIDASRSKQMVSVFLNHQWSTNAGVRQALSPIRLDAVIGLLSATHTESRP